MNTRNVIVAISLVAGLYTGSASAQMVVVDPGAIAQAVAQLQQLQQQYSRMKEQLDAVSGKGNMGNVGNSTYWNDWDQSNSANDQLVKQYGIQPYEGSNYKQNTIEENNDAVRSYASESNAVDQMLDRAVDRFDNINQMIAKIDTTTTLKETADLQARIAGEQAMLQNDMTKIQLLKTRYEMDRQRQSIRNSQKPLVSLGEAANGG